MAIISVSGHRQLADEESIRKDIYFSLSYFMQLHKDLSAVSALAEGADTIFAEEALKLGLPLKIILPFNLKEYEKDFSEDGLSRLRAILKNNNYEVAQKDIVTPSLRKEAYLQTGKMLVEEGDILLAVWDGGASLGKGGTADIVAYAELKNKSVQIIKAYRTDNQKDSIEKLFDKLDKNAIKYKNRRFEFAWILGLVCGVLAVLCFAVTLIFNELFSEATLQLRVLEISEVILLLASYFLLSFLANKWKNCFLNNRRNAEYLRSMIWYRNAGIPLPQLEQGSFNISERVLSIAKKLVQKNRSIRNFDNAKRMAWVLAAVQIDYHDHSRIKRFERKLTTIERMLAAIKILFFSSVAVKFLTELHIVFPASVSISPELLLKWTKFLIIILPPCYAAFEGVKFFGEWKRNIFLSKEIMTKLEKCQHEIISAATEEELLKNTTDILNILELENVDWTIRYSEKEIEAKVG